MQPCKTHKNVRIDPVGQVFNKLYEKIIFDVDGVIPFARVMDICDCVPLFVFVFLKKIRYMLNY
jgi:hypothetical protein